MLPISKVVRIFLGHALAAVSLSFGTMILATLIFVAGLFMAHDIDNPLAVPVEFMGWLFLSGVFAAILVGSSLVCSAGLQLLRKKRHFSFWVPVILMPGLFFAVALITIGESKGLNGAFLWTALLSVYFNVYWTILFSSDAAISFILAKLPGRTEMKIETRL